MPIGSNRGSAVSLPILAREVAKVLANDGEILKELGSEWSFVRIGNDLQNLPGEADCPFALVFYWNRNYGTQNGNQNSFNLVLQYCILAETLDADSDLEQCEDGIQIFTASDKCTKLGEVIIEALSHRMPIGAELAFGEFNIYEDAYPLYVGELLLQFNTYKLIGGKQKIK